MGIGIDIKCATVPVNSNHLFSECGNEYSNEPHIMDEGRIDLDISINDPCLNDSFCHPKYESATLSTITKRNSCPGTFYPISVEQPGGPNPPNPKVVYKATGDAVALKCVQRVIVYEFIVLVSGSYKVIASTEVRILDQQETTEMYSEPYYYLENSFAGIANEATMGTGYVPQLTWLNYLMATLHPSIKRKLPNVTSIPDTTIVALAFGDVYPRLFAIHMRLYGDEILSLGERKVVAGLPIVERERAGVSTMWFIVTAAILVYTVIVLAVLYLCQGPLIIGHVPTCLAGMYALLYASNAKPDCRPGDSPEERATRLDVTYAYGAFYTSDRRKFFSVYRESEVGVGLMAIDEQGE